MLHWTSFQKRTGLQPLGTVFTVKETEFRPSKGCGKHQLGSALMAAKQKIKKKKKKSTAKTGIFHHVEKLLEMSENHLFWEVHVSVISALQQSSKGLKVWTRIDWGEDSATILKTHLLGERYAAYCNCKKLKESKLAGSFSEVFLLLLTLMRFSPYQSCINNFCCVASVEAAAYKMKQTRCDSELGSREGWGDKHRGAEPFRWVIDLQIHVWDGWLDGWMSARSLLLQWSAALRTSYCALASGGRILASGKFI